MTEKESEEKKKMNVDLQTLAIISVLTTLTTECIKSWCKTFKKDCEPNIIAAIVAVVLSFTIEIAKPLLVDNCYIDGHTIYNFMVMAFFGMLSANLGYDKVKELILAMLPKR